MEEEKKLELKKNLIEINEKVFPVTMKMESFHLIRSWITTLALILLGEFPTCLGKLVLLIQQVLKLTSNTRIRYQIPLHLIFNFYLKYLIEL